MKYISPFDLIIKHTLKHYENNPEAIKILEKVVMVDSYNYPDSAYRTYTDLNLYVNIYGNVLLKLSKALGFTASYTKIGLSSSGKINIIVNTPSHRASANTFADLMLLLVCIVKTNNFQSAIAPVDMTDDFKIILAACRNTEQNE